MSFIVIVPPVRSARPVIETVPLSVSAPPAFTVKVFAVSATKSNAVVSVILISLPLSVVKVTVPVKALLALVSVISALSPSELSSTVLPPTLTTPFWVMVPALSTLRLPAAIETVPSTKSLASSMVTSLEPLLLKLTAP